jgi:hypothetical protein
MGVVIGMQFTDIHYIIYYTCTSDLGTLNAVLIEGGRSLVVGGGRERHQNPAVMGARGINIVGTALPRRV